MTCGIHQNACPSEMCSAVGRSSSPVGSGPAIELDAEVHTDRADRRSITHAEADRATQLARSIVVDRAEHVAPVDERHRSQTAAHGDAHLGVQHDERRGRLCGNPSWSIVSGVPSRSSANPRTVVSPPA